MFERPKHGESAVLVHIDFMDESVREQESEFIELVESAGASVTTLIRGKRHEPEAKYFVGKGKAEEIAQAVAVERAELVIINHDLSPAQERNIEVLVKARVLDRTGLILDIFAQRARTFEGKLQVELAQLDHLSTRLVRGWTHLERQKGGIGLRGPGETQLETDRRLLRQRVKTIKQRIEKVRRQRAQSRKARAKAHLPTVSLVGYTNAGKSTLFNRLTEADVYEADQLFATLDPTLRRINIPILGRAIVADTVGFIRHLPHTLVAAFRATLEETHNAELLLHVVDVSDEEQLNHLEEVNQVLEQVGADSVPKLMVYNKIDLEPGAKARIETNIEGRPSAVWLSAKSGDGLDLLKEAIAMSLSHHVMHQTFRLPFEHAGSLRAEFYAKDAVFSESTDPEGGCLLEVRASAEDIEALFSKHQLRWEAFIHTPSQK